MGRSVISVRLDDRALEALVFLEASGLRRSEAIREALVEEARRVCDERMREAAAAIADPGETLLARTIRVQMRELADEG
jgi:hypothetical protein